MSETKVNAGQGGGSGQQRIQGVFSSQEVKRVGTGTTTRKTIQKAFWYCEEKKDGSLELQPLNPNYIPSGPKKTINKEQFLAHFSPEPELYISTVYPKMREITKTVAMAERFREHNELYSAEMEYGKVLKVDEENVRANFGLGITYLERGDTSRAQNIFSRVVKLDGAFEEEHKHLFNEFGIKLRKNGMLDQALDYYERALTLTRQDENLFYNLARAWLDKKNMDKTIECLFKALEINPKLEPAAKFLAWVEEKNLVPENKKQEVAALLENVKPKG
ncbi:MAG: tetratricopeptide repeat protein [Desulfovibrio sp.]|jgi:tetratricopeptide (TPR) repeat protein|nr:tetratricopeptide repeat protein [Desulfovibrio sp.]